MISMGKATPQPMVVVIIIKRVVVIKTCCPLICSTCAQHKQPLTTPPNAKLHCSSSGIENEPIHTTLNAVHMPMMVINRLSTTTTKRYNVKNKFTSSEVNAQSERPTYEKANPSAISDIATKEILVASCEVLLSECHE